MYWHKCWFPADFFAFLTSSALTPSLCASYLISCSGSKRTDSQPLIPLLPYIYMFLWDFRDVGLLVRHISLVCDSYSSDQRFASCFLQIPSRPGHPCRSANGCPYRVHSGLPSPSKSAMPGAPQKSPGQKAETQDFCLITLDL